MIEYCSLFRIGWSGVASTGLHYELYGTAWGPAPLAQSIILCKFWQSVRTTILSRQGTAIAAIKQPKRKRGKMAEMKSMGVVGSGQMGSGIAQLGAVHGLDVWLIDSNPEALARSSKSISSSIQRLVSKGQLSQVPYPPLLSPSLLYSMQYLGVINSNISLLTDRPLFPKPFSRCTKI